MQRFLFLSICFCIILTSAGAQQHEFDPPWNTPPVSPVMFTVAGVDNIPDLFGDINDPQLVIFFGGNEYMVIGELIAAFKKAFPVYQRVFVETLPPGILAKQIAGGSITIGNMRISLKAMCIRQVRARSTKHLNGSAKPPHMQKITLPLWYRKGTLKT